MRALLLLCLVWTTGCTGFQTGFKKGFDKSFGEKCVKSATEKGATEARAKEYCQCALQKVNAGSSIDQAAEACQ
jgi:hypothetical protein